MPTIETAGALRPGTANTPLDQRCRVNTLSQIPEIELPFVGMLVYCVETGKFYTVTKLKSKLIGALTVPDAAVDTYEEFSAGGGGDDSSSSPATTAADITITDANEHYESRTVEGALAEAAQALAGKADSSAVDEALRRKVASDLVGAAGGLATLGADGKVPASQLPPAAESTALPASTLTLPIPADDDGNNISLIVDFSENGDFSEGSYTRVTMIDHFAKMRIFTNDCWEPLQGTYVGSPYYYGSVCFTLDDEMLPGYTPGKTYFGRYTWMDSQGAFDGWIGFSFSGDLADLRPIRLPEKVSLDVAATRDVSGTVAIDYVDGEVQNLRLTGDTTLQLSDVSGVAFGFALILNVDLNYFTLTVQGKSETLTYSGGRTYMVVFSNFGELNISVCEVL